MNFVYFVMMFFVFCQMPALQAMELKKSSAKVHKQKNNALVVSRDYLMQHPEIRSASRLFGNTGVGAEIELLRQDEKFRARKNEGLLLLKQLLDVANDYDELVDMTSLAMSECASHLPFIYSDALYDEFVDYIEKNYNKLFAFAKEKNHDDTGAQALCADVDYVVENISMVREGAKKIFLEAKIIEVLDNCNNKIDESLWCDTTQTVLKKVEKLSQEYELCIGHLRCDEAKRDAQKQYSTLCYEFSRYALLRNFKRVAIKYGEKASSLTMELGHEAHKEYTKSPFKKRRLSRPKPFEKKQKMSDE